MKVVKMILKVALLPVIAVLWVMDLLVNMLFTVGSYVLGPLMFFIFFCGIYTVVKQLWNQTFFSTYGRFLCAGFLRGRLVYYPVGGRKRKTGGLHQSIKENGMDRTIMEDYYDQKYGENMEKNPWEKSPEYQELLEKRTRIEDAIRGLLGNENHRVWQLYEDAMSVQFAMEEVGIKYMYLRGAEDRERMLR